MADNLNFPILFDLEKGVDIAIKNWNDKYADRLEKAIQKRALGVKLKFDTKALDNLDDVKRRLAELKITPLTPENKTAIRDLVRELKELARIMEKIQKFKGIELPELQMAKAAKLRKDVAQADEKLQLSKERVRQAEERLILSQQRAAQQANRTSRAFSDQGGYLERLIKKMAIYASFSMVGNFLTSVREVTAQFELQRVSLGAILQDANKGEQIFSQIKQFALNSPLSILDMTRYTKQLAAYKIEYDELFEMTKRFADISVGLGVDYQRIVLAAGQTRTATYLRASELKQFTELGVPLLEELSIKLSKMNGEMVSTAEVMDMISKRAISWELVKEVLYDMTDAGGMFYNMQIQQGNTLYGLWQKLGDAASVMYEQIGNTGWVNSGMKEAIQLLTELMRNWKATGLTVATTILPAVAAMAAWKMATKSLAKTVTAATNERIIAEAKLATAMKGTDIAAQNAARSTLAKAKADEAAAIAAQKHTSALAKLKMGLVSLGKFIVAGLGIGIAITLVAQLVYKISEAITNFRKLEKELGSIYSETATLQDQSVRNFEFLADKAVKAANGSKEQTDALQELNRTYRDILPQEALTIENLTRMKGNYDALTQSIKEYIAEQQRQKAESSIFEYYGTKIRDAQMDVRERLYDQDLSATEVGRFFAEFEKIAPKYGNDVWSAFRDAMIAAGVKDKKRIAQIWKKEFKFSQRDIVSSDTGNANIRALSEAYADQANELKGMNEQYRESIGNLGKFADMQKRVSDTIANATYKTTGGKPIDTDKQGDLLDAMKFNLWVKRTAAEIQNSEDIKKAFAFMGEGIKAEWFNIIDTINSNDLGKVSQINFDAIIASVDKMIADLGNKNPEILTILNTFRNYLVSQKKQYENMAPSETVIVRWRNRWREIVKELQISGQNMNRFLMQSSEDFEAYRKRIKEEVTAVINQINILNEAVKARISARAAGDDNYTKEQEAADKKKLKQAEERKKALQKLLADLDKIEIKSGKDEKGGKKSDNRLSLLKELFSEYKAMYDEYKKLSETLGADKAAAKMEDVYGEVAKQFKKYGLEIPMTAKKAANGMQVLIDAMEKLRSAKDKKGNPLFATLEKDISSSKATLANFNAEEFRKQIETELKRLADRISRTKTAKEFYEKILEQTGDIDIATRVSMSIYGSTGEELFNDTVEQIREAFKTGSEEHPIDLDISAAIDLENQRIDYKKLADIYDKYQDEIIEKRRDTAKKIAQEGQKEVATNIANWQKELAKAKDFEQRRTDIIRTAAAEREKIIKEVRDPKEREELLNLSREKESQDLAKVNFEEFTKSEDYIKIFENLDNVATSSLKRLRAEMQALIDTNQNLSPENMKTLVKAMEDIDEQISGRGFGNDMIQSVNDYIAAIKNLKIAKQELAKAEAEYQAQEPRLDADIETAKTEKESADKDVVTAQQKLLDIQTQMAALREQEIVDETQLAALQAQEIVAANALTSAKLKQNQAATAVTTAEQAKAKAAKKVEDAEEDVTEQQDKQKKATTKFVKDLQKVASTADQLAGELSEIKDLLGISEDSAAGLVFDSAISSLQQMSTAIGIATTAQALFNAIAESNPYIAIAAGVLAVGSAIASWISGSKVRKANKEIERQQELLDQLEYTYGRLEKAAEKVFGADYVNNYQQQIKNLQAQQSAYLKQAEAERGKGKKEDESKTKEYLDNARDIADQIADMQNNLSARFLGSDIASAARDFANAWLEAYKEFGNTADAMNKKFQEMIQNMIAESLLAQVMKRALQPAFEMIDNMEDADFYSQAFWARLQNEATKGAQNADVGAQTVMKFLEQSGIKMRELGGDLTGISRDIAGASEESIKGLSMHMHTVEWYVAQISRDVALMAGRASGSETVASEIDWRHWQNEALNHLAATAQHTAQTVAECKNIVKECHDIATDVHRVMGEKNGKFAIRTIMVG